MKKLLEKIFSLHRTPRMIQMENSECGAAALGMILGHFGKHIPLEELREICGVSRDGLSLEDIEIAASYYGLKSETNEADVEDLIKGPFPTLLWWQHNHFVVLERVSGGNIFINDPAVGHRTIFFSELAKNFSGLMMDFQKGENFQPSGKRETFLSRVIDKLDPFKPSLSYLFWIQVGLTLLGLTIPVFAQVFIDQFFGSTLPTWDWDFLGLILGALILSALLTYAQQIFLNFLQVRIAVRLSVQFLCHLLQLPALFFSQRYASELINRLKLNTRIGEVLTNGIVLNVLNLLLLSSYWIIMLFYNVTITMIAAGIALYNLVLVWFIGKKRSNSYAKLQQSEAHAVSGSFDALEHIEAVKSNADENFFFKKIAGFYTENINNAQEIGKQDVWLSTLSSLSQKISMIVILAFGAWEVIEGRLTIGKLIALQILYNNFLAPVTQLVFFSTEVQSVEVDLTRLDDVLHAKADPVLGFRKEGALDTTLEGELTLEKVSFGYKPLQPPFMQDLDLQVKKGEMIGLTGSNGSGKTTLAKLVTCLLQPREGAILYDAKPYQDYTRETLSRSVGYVDQIIELFPGNLRDNLTLWNAEISEEAMIKAAESAYIHEDIALLAEGYLSTVLEEGINFSAGQKQRLEIARVLLKNPALLILDEATNALDAEVEEKILANIRKLGITTFLISHRLSTFHHCDRILVMDEGSIVQQGTHQELTKQKGLYRNLIELELKKKL